MLACVQSQFKPLLLGTHTAIGGAIAGGGIGDTIAYIRESRAEIEAERNRWQSLFRNDPNGIVDLAVRDGRPVIEAANEQFATLFSCSAFEGNTLQSVVDHTDTALPDLADAIADETALATEFTTTIDGEEKHLTAQLVPYSTGTEPKAFCCTPTSPTSGRHRPNLSPRWTNSRSRTNASSSSPTSPHTTCRNRCGWSPVT
jgi:hypothetical protein